MNKKDIKYYAIIAFVLILTIVFEIMKPKQIDWTFNLEASKKSPYGTFVLFNTIQEIFPNKKIITNKKTTTEFNNNKNKILKNYIYISDVFSADKLETKTILNILNKGNSVFISAHDFSRVFKDTFKISVKYTSFFDTIGNYNFYNKKLKRKNPFFFGKSASKNVFSGFNGCKTEVLAFSKNKEPIFIKQTFDKGGVLYLNTSPEIFTNYGMVTEKNFEFTYKSLSYLKLNDIVWDEYYKPFRKRNKGKLDFIFNSQSLKIAYIILLVTTGIFVFFTIKRRQRIIPIIKPFENKTLEFVETISSVYFNSKNHKDIALKKHQHLKYFLFNKYFIKLPENKDVDYNIIAEKTGVHIDIVKKVLQTYTKINKLEKISQQELNNFNNSIEDFYENCK